MKYGTLGFALTLLSISNLAAEDRKERHLFLLIGQSNMAGRAMLEDADKQPIPNAFLWNIGEKKWVPAAPPFNLYSPSRKQVSMQRLNCGPTFVKAYLEKHKDVEVGIVCAARGGSSIEQWEKGGKDRFQLYKHAIEAAKAAAPDGEFKAILWHQGESNSANISTYAEKLAKLVDNLRKDLGKPDLPFVFSELGRWNKNFAEFNKLIVTLPEKIAQTACVTTEELKGMDNAHFDTAGQRELGKRYFEKLEKLLAKK